ncbi:MAG: PEGA domain-containing protein [Lachnospiraceae bacterium]|nr:PEGA domain-containing protein [Lachnospiraceae bacterium]
MKSEKRVLLLLAASAGVIILVTVLTLFPGKESSAGSNKNRPTVRPTVTPVLKPAAEYNILAMVKSVDTAEGTITLYNLEKGGEVTLTYGVAADIRGKYGRLSYAASFAFGDIVRVEYDKEDCLVRMQESSEHWELHGVEEFSVTDSMLTVNNTNYKITDNTVVYCEGEEIQKGEVKAIDRVNLCGLGSEIISICVTKGHGSVKLINCEEFQGAEVTFGDETHTLDGEPSYLIREGKYTILVKTEEKAAAAEVTVARNEQVVIDLYEYGGAPVQTSEVRFHISPFSALLRIDGVTTEYYEQDLTLSYGEHQIEAELGGYVTYKGILRVSKPYQTVKIDLSERTASDIGGGNTQVGDGSGGTGDGSGEIGDGGSGIGDGGSGGLGEELPDTGTAERRYVAIGEAAGYEYDKNHSTFILVPEGAVVLIDGISLGMAPVEFEKILGTYTVTLRKGGNEKEYTVTVEDDGEDVYWKFPME